MKPLFKAEVMLVVPYHIGCHWQPGAKIKLICVVDPGHRELPRSCWASVAI